MSDSEDPIDPLDEGGDDLFGDEADEVASTKERVLDDDDLASDPEGHDYYRTRNDYDDDQPQPETKDRVVMNIQAYRHRIPKPKDGSLRVMRVPKFIKIHPELYDPETFEATDFDVENARSQNPKHVARVRRDQSTDELKSNSNIFRWSDGSVTISVGGEHYEISKKGLAPPSDKPYNELHDGHYYAAAAELASNLLMTVGHVTEQYNVRPSKAVGDDALSVLAEQMAQASKTAHGGDMIIRTTRDPELQKRQAEMAEKERMKAQRRRENAAAKMDGGLGRSGRGGLSIGDLEGGRRGAGSGKRGAPGSSRPRHRNPEYDSDDDLQGPRRGEGYDYDDGFLVASDEEVESGVDDDDEEILDDSDREAPRSKKRQRRRDADDDEDAEGDDLDMGETAGRMRRRQVIDDDED